MTGAERATLRVAVDQARRSLLLGDPLACPGCGCARDCGPTLGCRTCLDRISSRRRRAREQASRPPQLALF